MHWNKFVKILMICTSILCLIGCSSNTCEDTSQPLDTNEMFEEAKKPVVYVYGYDEEVNVELMVADGNEITCTYPKAHKNKWTMSATKDGKLKIGELEYQYLYWEANVKSTFDFSKGYCIAGEDTAEFLDLMCAQLGLNRTEANEFIVYWLPRMEKNPYNIISFQTKAYFDDIKLNVTPSPDKVIRICMAWYGVTEKQTIEPQNIVNLSNYNRTGKKVVVEWGGCEVKKGKSQPESVDNVTSTISTKDSTSGVIENPYAYLKDSEHNASTDVLYTDYNGTSHSFTREQWDVLLDLWSWTGQAEINISKQTIEELLVQLGLSD